MPATRIVVIEDEPAIRRGVVDALRASGFEAGEAADGDRGLEEASGPNVRLVLLDLLLPRRDGLSVLAELRKIRPGLPVIILTARGGEDDRVRGLKMGADDYVVKPFSARELLARIEAVLRRTVGQAEELGGARLGRAVIDFRRREVRWSERERCELSETEAAILGFLVSHQKRAVSREELLSRVWGLEPRGLETRTVDMHIARLRTKLRDPSGRNHIEAILTVRAHGYMAGPDLIPLEQPAAGETVP
jgi:DNA-binding response OmpR family regulator